MTWNCPICQEELGELNGYCVYCKIENGSIVYNPDRYYIRDIRIYHITNGDNTVTPQEELFSKLFNHEKILVKDMDTLTLRAHRESLAQIAFEARARLTAVDDEDNERKKTKRSADGKAQGFERSVNTDETTTAAINTIKERQGRLSKADKIRANLLDMYMKGGMTTAEATAEADRLMSAGTILIQTKRAVEDAKIEATKIKSTEPAKPLFNPFEKK